jgi:hypothetical protein
MFEPAASGCKELGDFHAKVTFVRSDFTCELGIDQIIRGLARLKKAAGITEEIYGETLATLEHSRA